MVNHSFLFVTSGQRCGPDSPGGVSANHWGAAAGGQHREPAEEHQGPRARKIKTRKPRAESRREHRGSWAWGRPPQRPEGGAVSHLLPAASDVHRWPKHRQVGPLSGNSVEKKNKLKSQCLLFYCGGCKAGGFTESETWNSVLYSGLIQDWEEHVCVWPFGFNHSLSLTSLHDHIFLPPFKFHHLKVRKSCKSPFLWVVELVVPYGWKHLPVSFSWRAKSCWPH